VRAVQRRRVPTRTQSVCRQPATCLRYYAACEESPIVRHPSFTRLTNILMSSSVTPSRAIIIMTIGSLRRSSSDGSRGTRLRPICDGWCMGAPELGWLGKTHAITLLRILNQCIVVTATVCCLSERLECRAPLKSPVPSSPDPYPATPSASLELPGDVACRSGSDRLCLKQQRTAPMLQCNIMNSNRY
jgi:hypothetical protein